MLPVKNEQQERSHSWRYIIQMLLCYFGDDILSHLLPILYLEFSQMTNFYSSQFPRRLRPTPNLLRFYIAPSTKSAYNKPTFIYKYRGVLYGQLQTTVQVLSGTRYHPGGLPPHLRHFSQHMDENQPQRGSQHGYPQQDMRRAGHFLRRHHLIHSHHQ